MEAVTNDLPTSPTVVETSSRHAKEDWRGLFADIAAGRLNSLATLYDEASHQLYGLALWRTGSSEDASDVVQDVFVRLVEQGRRLSHIRNPRAWLLTVAHRAAIDVTRRRKRRTAENLDDFAFLTATEGDGDRVANTVHVSALLGGLSEKHRDVVFLKHFAGCTFAEIGEIVGIPKFTAASRYRSAIERLKQLLGGDHDTR